MIKPIQTTKNQVLKTNKKKNISKNSKQNAPINFGHSSSKKGTKLNLMALCALAGFIIGAELITQDEKTKQENRNRPIQEAVDSYINTKKQLNKSSLPKTIDSLKTRQKALKDSIFTKVLKRFGTLKQ